MWRLLEPRPSPSQEAHGVETFLARVDYLGFLLVGSSERILPVRVPAGVSRFLSSVLSAGVPAGFLFFLALRGILLCLENDSKYHSFCSGGRGIFLPNSFPFRDFLVGVFCVLVALLRDSLGCLARSLVGMCASLSCGKRNSSTSLGCAQRSWRMPEPTLLDCLELAEAQADGQWSRTELRIAKHCVEKLHIFVEHLCVDMFFFWEKSIEFVTANAS